MYSSSTKKMSSFEKKKNHKEKSKSNHDEEISRDRTKKKQEIEDEELAEEYDKQLEKDTTIVRLSPEGEFSSETELEKNERAERVLRIKRIDLKELEPKNKDSNDGVKYIFIGKPKCLYAETQVLLYNGEVKQAKDVSVDDVLVGEDGSPRRVQVVEVGEDDLYQVSTDYDEEGYIVSSNHLITVFTDKIIDVPASKYTSGLAIRPFVSMKCYDPKVSPHYVGYFLASGKTVVPPQFSESRSCHTDTDTDPLKYIMTSVTKRLEFLSGVTDYFSKKNKIICNQFLTEKIVRLLLYSCMTNFKFDNNSFICSMGFPNRDLENVNFMTRMNVKSLDRKGKVYGFHLEENSQGNQRFLLANFTLTHNSGKSLLLKSVMQAKNFIPVCQIYSGTEDSNHSFAKNVPAVNIYNGLSNENIELFIKRQKIAMKHIPDNPWGLLGIDDCFERPSQFRDPLWLGIFKNSRQWKMVTLISMQWCFDLIPSERSQIDYSFIFAEPSDSVRKRLWSNFGSVVGSFNNFCDIMTQGTENHASIVFKNLESSNKLEDRIGWHRTNLDIINSDWKFGHPLSWKFSEDRLDPEYKEAFNY